MASADEYAAWIVKNADKKGTPDFETVARAYQAAKAGSTQPSQPRLDPSEGEGTLQFGPFDTGIKLPQGVTRTLAGAGKAFSDVGTGVQQLGAGIADFVSPKQTSLSDLILNDGKPRSRVGDLRREVAQTRALDKPLMDTGTGMAGNIAGNVALFAPTAMLPGANTITGGALVGAGAGLLQPSASTGETVANTGLGALSGALVPAAIQGGKVIKAAAEPFYDKGRNLIVGRALNRAAGADAPQVANLIGQAVEHVPGSKPTVGQAAENAGIAALQRSAAAINPEVTNALEKATVSQNDARVNLLKQMAGSDGGRDFAAINRDVTGNQLYGEAFKNGIPAQAMTPEAQANIAGFYQRMPAEVLDYAKKLAKINGQPMTDETSLQGLHWVKQAMDGLISQAKKSGDNTMARAYTGLQSDFLSGLDKLSPDYGAARNVFASMSKPINQMDVAQELLDRSVNPLTGTMQPAAFARAASDPKLAARATGFNGATLENTMDIGQTNAIGGLLKDLQRSAYAQNAGRGPGSDTVQKLAYANILDQSGVPTFLRNFAPTQVLGNIGGRVADAGYARANRELSNRLAEIMLDPKSAAELMKNATPAEKSALLQLVQRTGSGAAITAPAIANSQK
jgi:hypothetical protein